MARFQWVWRIDATAQPYTLRMGATGRVDGYGKARLAYQFGPQGKPALFEGEDFCCSPMHAIDSRECAADLLGFLTLKPGDTDSEYFNGYSPEQMAFAQSGDAEYLGMIAGQVSDPRATETTKAELREIRRSFKRRTIEA